MENKSGIQSTPGRFISYMIFVAVVVLFSGCEKTKAGDIDSLKGLKAA